jgi:4-amino-4-deoxy-L-arabinose transferase-like glycosyltransferase
MYHLAAPARDVVQGRVLTDVANFQGYQPQLVEMLYLDGLLLHGDGEAALLHVVFGLLGLLTLVGMVRQMTGIPGKRAALAVRVAALYLSIPSLVLVLGWAYVDGALVFYELAALGALLCWWHAKATSRLRWLLLTGTLAGLALDVKYTGAWALMALGVLVGWRAWRVAGLRAFFWQVGVLVGVALLAGLPWLLRNLLLTGDPLFPYHVGHVFAQGPLWDDGRTLHAVEGPGWGWAQAWRVLTLPLEVTIFGTQGSVEFDATLGPLLLLLLPLGLLLRPTGEAAKPTRAAMTTRDGVDGWAVGRVVGVLLAFAAILWVCWGVELLNVHFARQSRLFFPLFAALTLPAAVVLLRLTSAAGVAQVSPAQAPPAQISPGEAPSVQISLVQTPPLLARLATGAVLLALLCGLLAQGLTTLGSGNLAYLLGLQSREAYLADHLDPYYSAMQEINSLPPAAHLLFLWEVRSYYAVHAVNADPFLDNFDYVYRHCPTPERMLRCFRQAGFTHILLYAQGVELIVEGRPGALTAPEWTALGELLTQVPAPLYSDTTPLIRNGQAVAAGPLAVEQALGGQGWYRLYALSDAEG